MFSTLLTLALLAAPPPTPAPSPTPPPSQDDPEAFETPPPAFPEPTPYAERRQLPDVAIVPSLGVGGHVGEDAHGRSIAGVHLWAGVLFHPAPSKFGPMMGVGASFDGVSSREGKREDGETYYGMPELRYGVAFLDRPHRYESALFPIAGIYFIGGWRPERGTGGGLYRAGMGISSPMFFAVSLAETCIPLPSMLEVVADAPEGEPGDARTSFRAGWQF